MIYFNVQIPCFNHGFPEEKQKEEHDKENQRPFHHASEVKAKWETWIGPEEEHLSPYHAVPHHQQGDGVNSHDGKQHPSLISEPTPTNERNQHLKEMKSINGEDAVNTGNLCVPSVPEFC